MQYIKRFFGKQATLPETMTGLRDLPHKALIDTIKTKVSRPDFRGVKIDPNDEDTVRQISFDVKYRCCYGGECFNTPSLVEQCRFPLCNRLQPFFKGSELFAQRRFFEVRRDRLIPLLEESTAVGRALKDALYYADAEENLAKAITTMQMCTPAQWMSDEVLKADAPGADDRVRHSLRHQTVVWYSALLVNIKRDAEAVKLLQDCIAVLRKKRESLPAEKEGDQARALVDDSILELVESMALWAVLHDMSLLRAAGSSINDAEVANLALLPAAFRGLQSDVERQTAGHLVCAMELTALSSRMEMQQQFKAKEDPLECCLAEMNFLTAHVGAELVEVVMERALMPPLPEDQPQQRYADAATRVVFLHAATRVFPTDERIPARVKELLAIARLPPPPAQQQQPSSGTNNTP